MRILYVHNFYQQPGGEDRVFYDECDLLKSKGHEVETFTKSNDELLTLGKLQTVRKTFGNQEATKELGESIQQFKPDVVHFANTFPLISPAAYWAVKSRRIPVVKTLHNFRTVCPGALLMKDGVPCEKCVGKTFAWPAVIHGCYRESKAATAVVAAMTSWHRFKGTWTNAIDAYIALTEFSKQRFVRGGLPQDKIFVKPNFVRDADDQAAKPVERDGAVFIGRLTKEKGVLVLLDAWKKMNSPIRLQVIGDGPLAGRVQKAAAEDPRITWHPRLTHAEVLQTLRGAETGIVPSIWYETFGLTTIEAFSVGTPVVGSNLGAMAELITDRCDGLLFAAGDSSGLADRVQKICGQPAFAKGLGTAARKTYLQKYEPETNYRQLLKIYQRCLETTTAR